MLKGVMYTVFFFMLGCLVAADAAPPPSTIQATVLFSPHGGCTDAVVAAIDAARQEVNCMAYVFTNRKIEAALENATIRGITVTCILDARQANRRESLLPKLRTAGIPTFIDSHESLMHNKVMIIDGETILTGSFNFTEAAENRNAENLLVITSKELASQYNREFKVHKSHSSGPEKSSLQSGGEEQPAETAATAQAAGVGRATVAMVMSGCKVPSPLAGLLFASTSALAVQADACDASCRRSNQACERGDRIPQDSPTTTNLLCHCRPSGEKTAVATIETAKGPANAGPTITDRRHRNHRVRVVIACIRRRARA